MTEKDRCDYVFRVQNVSWGSGICSLLSSPPPGICHPKQKSANARGLARGGGGWAQLELTDALTMPTESLVESFKTIKSPAQVHNDFGSMGCIDVQFLSGLFNPCAVLVNTR